MQVTVGQGLIVTEDVSQLKLCSHRCFQGPQEATGDDVADDAVWNRGHRNDSGSHGLSIPQHVRGEGGAAVQDCAALVFHKRLEAGRDPPSITLLNAFRVMSCGGNLTHKKAIQLICTTTNNSHYWVLMWDWSISFAQVANSGINYGFYTAHDAPPPPVVPPHPQYNMPPYPRPMWDRSDQPRASNQ